LWQGLWAFIGIFAGGFVGAFAKLVFDRRKKGQKGE
jgi:gas vesicle protein